MATDIVAAQDRAVSAVRYFYTADHSDIDQINAERSAREAVESAIRAGVTHHQLASLAGIPGLLVARLIDDPDAHVAALNAERHAAHRYERDVLDAIQGAARRLVDPESGKGARGVRSQAGFAKAAGVDRAAVRTWLGL
jgi:hypothetical protein